MWRKPTEKPSADPLTFDVIGGAGGVAGAEVKHKLEVETRGLARKMTSEANVKKTK